MADLIKWDESCQVGVREFDEAHQSLFAVGNRLIRSVIENRATEVLRPIIDELIEYTERHFQREEEVLQQTGYPGYESHRKEHRKLMNEVRLFKSRFIAEDIEAAEVSMFLVCWILNHIKGTDRNYRDHLHANGIS